MADEYLIISDCIAIGHFYNRNDAINALQYVENGYVTEKSTYEKSFED